MYEGRESTNAGTTDVPGILPNSMTGMYFNGTGAYRDFGTTVKKNLIFK